MTIDVTPHRRGRPVIPIRRGRPPHMFLRAAALIAAALLGVGVLPAPASAAGDLDTSWYVLRNAQTGFCLDGNSSGVVYAHPCIDGNRNQQWSRESTYSTVRQRATSRCLHHYADRHVATSTSLLCGAWSTTGMRWVDLPLRAGSEVQLVANGGGWMCLDSNDEFNPGSNTKKVFTSPCNVDDRGQGWRYTDADPDGAKRRTP